MLTSAFAMLRFVTLAQSSATSDHVTLLVALLLCASMLFATALFVIPLVVVRRWGGTPSIAAHYGAKPVTSRINARPTA